ncbi:hypothetical protein [Vibrio scophthalmi]|uniref:Transposase n=1 Tax=Vibrio scophthalmi LMG 19158 TaxID=870967 RepID=F9RKP1_9VIBR|nr:hypothetical protein [Vibrio scophthalmi]EGU39462.1 hypothetical protein VIS19158_18521 [Vibrio scophthalmi LMG 19158]
MSNYKELKRRQRTERDMYSQNLSLRVHRALIWLNKSKLCDDELYKSQQAETSIKDIENHRH